MADTIRIPAELARKASEYLTKAHSDGAFKGCAVPLGGLKVAQHLDAILAGPDTARERWEVDGNGAPYSIYDTKEEESSSHVFDTEQEAEVFLTMAREFVSQQIGYCDAELVRMARAETLALKGYDRLFYKRYMEELGLHPLTLEEIRERRAEVVGMRDAAPDTHGPLSGLSYIAWNLNRESNNAGSD